MCISLWTLVRPQLQKSGHSILTSLLPQKWGHPGWSLTSLATMQSRVQYQSGPRGQPADINLQLNILTRWPRLQLWPG
jgi:hypothetical protein